VDLVTIDFETYYDKEYSLSKITIEEYIRSDKFEVIGVSVKMNDNPADWYSGGDVYTFLNSLDYSDKAILCHHAAFDGAILSWVYDIKPRLWLDTLSMARPKHAVTVGGSLKMLTLSYGVGEKGTEVVDALGKHRKDFTPTQLAKYGQYCVNDSEITYKLFKKLQNGFPVSELMVIDQIIRMYTEPILELDRWRLEKHLAEIVAKKMALLNKLGGGGKAKKILMSNPKFATLLDKLGVEVPMKISLRTGKLTYAFAKTDQGLLDLLEHSNPAVVAVVEARMGVKSTIEETRTARLIDVSQRGPLPIMLNYYGAHTGRFSGGDKLNLQNLPIRQGSAIRDALCAPEGYKVIACDSSQIEARILATIAKQHDLIKAFREGRDVYKDFASMVYHVGVNDVDENKRFIGKTCILGLGYGMGPPKFQDTLRRGSPSMKGANTTTHMNDLEASRIVYFYREIYQAISQLWKECDGVLVNMVAGQSGIIRDFLAYTPEGIELPNGLVIKYNELTYDKDAGYQYISDARQFRKLAKRVVADSEEKIAYTSIYGGKMVENIVQALARIVVTEQMVAIKEAGYPVALQVHDENVVVVRTEDVVTAQQVMEHVMSTPPIWMPTLPVACKSAIGDNYGECK
jgi:DNA polymerase